MSWDDYVYRWFIVNTRSFYYVRPGTKKEDILPPNDCMALCPFIDYPNHANDGVSPIDFLRMFAKKKRMRRRGRRDGELELRLGSVRCGIR